MSTVTQCRRRGKQQPQKIRKGRHVHVHSTVSRHVTRVAGGNASLHYRSSQDDFHCPLWVGEGLQGVVVHPRVPRRPLSPSPAQHVIRTLEGRGAPAGHSSIPIGTWMVAAGTEEGWAGRGSRWCRGEEQGGQGCSRQNSRCSDGGKGCGRGDSRLVINGGAVEGAEVPGLGKVPGAACSGLGRWGPGGRGRAALGARCSASPFAAYAGPKKSL